MALASDPVYGVPPRAELRPSDQDNTRLTTRGQQSRSAAGRYKGLWGKEGLLPTEHLLRASRGLSPLQDHVRFSGTLGRRYPDSRFTDKNIVV